MTKNRAGFATANIWCKLSVREFSQLCRIFDIFICKYVCRSLHIAAIVRHAAWEFAHHDAV